MFSKVVVFFAAIVIANAGYLEPALRYATPAIHAAPAINFATPAIARVEHLPPAVASSYKTDVFTPPIAKTYEIAPAVTHVAPAPLVHVAPAPEFYAAPAPAVSFATPAISKIEHLAPAVASSYKTEVLTGPSARTYEIAPAVTHFAPAPAVSFAAPAVHAAPLPLLRAGPAHFGFEGHYGHEYPYKFGFGLGHAKYF